MITLRRILLTSAMAALTVGISSAASIAGSCTGATAPTELNVNVSCTKFNTNLGTLTDVVLTITGSISGTITLTNNAATTQNVRGTTATEFDLNTTLQGFAGLTSGVVLFTPTYNTGVQAIAAGATFTSGTLTNSNGSPVGPLTNTTVATFNAYSGPAPAGNFTFNVTTFSSLTIAGGGGQIQGGQSTSGTIGATVSYDYTPVVVGTPEPATMALMGSALLGLGLIRKRATK